MAHLHEYNIASTFHYQMIIPPVPGNEAEMLLTPINFAHLNRRHRISSFATVFSEHTITVSVFTQYAENRNNRGFLASVSFTGLQQLRPQRCSRFHMYGGRLLCHLAASAAQAAYFLARFPTGTLRARGKFIQTSSNRRRTAVKITMLDSELEVLEPRSGQIIHRLHGVRSSLLERIESPDIAAGTLFIYVSPEDVHQDYSRVRVNTSAAGLMKVPRSLAELLRRVYPQRHYPAHVVNFMMYLDMVNLRQVNLTSTDVDFVDSLPAYSLRQVMEVVILGIDILKWPVLGRVFNVIGEKIDELGDVTINELSHRLGFFMISD